MFEVLWRVCSSPRSASHIGAYVSRAPLNCNMHKLSSCVWLSCFSFSSLHVITHKSQNRVPEFHVLQRSLLHPGLHTSITNSRERTSELHVLLMTPSFPPHNIYNFAIRVCLEATIANIVTAFPLLIFNTARSTRTPVHPSPHGL